VTTDRLHTILGLFGLSAPFETTLVTSGLINPTRKITSRGKHYILQQINTAVFKRPEDIASNLDAIDQYLNTHAPEYLFVAPLKTTTGELLVWDNGNCYRLFPFVESSHTIDVVSTPDQAFEAALQFGRFTRLLNSFDARQLKITIPDFHNLLFRRSQFNDAIKNGNRSRIQRSSSLIGIVKQYDWVVETYDDVVRQNLIKTRVTHHDTKISNVLFGPKGRGLCVIDLDTVMPGYFISDFGDMMRTYLSPSSEESQDFNSIVIRDEYFKAIAEAFLSQLNDLLSEQERRFIVYSGFFMTYMQAIRFLADYCNDDVYYGARYEDHNYMRAANQLTLLQRMSEKKKAMEALLKKA